MVKVNREDSIQIVGYSFNKDFIITVNTHPDDWMLYKYVLGSTWNYSYEELRMNNVGATRSKVFPKEFQSKYSTSHRNFYCMAH